MQTEVCYHKYNYIQQRADKYRHYSILVNCEDIAEQYIVETDSNFQTQAARKPIVYEIQQDTLNYQKWKLPRKKTCIEQVLYTVPLINANLCKRAEIEVDTIPFWVGTPIKVDVYELKPDPNIVDIKDLQQEIYFIANLGVIWKQVYKNPLWKDTLISVEEM